MKGTNPEDIAISTAAVEELLAGSLRITSMAFGRTRIVKALGISMSRLHRLLSQKKPARPTFDLIYRMHRNLGFDWPFLFTAQHHEGVILNILAKSLAKNNSPIDEKEIEEQEDKVRIRLREIIQKESLTRCAKGTGIPRASLHSYLESTSLSVSLIWRIHLFTGVPYTIIITGKLSEDEKSIQQKTTDTKDFSGRFPDLYEPIVSFAERCAYAAMYEAVSGYVPFIYDLLDKKMTTPQYMRLVRILSLFEKGKRNYKVADLIVKKGWQRLKKSRDSSNLALLTLHLGIAAGLQVPGLSGEIASHIKSLTKDKLVLANVYRVQANEACIMMKMFDAERLARKASYFAENVKGPLKDNAFAYSQYILCMASWPLGDYAETLSRVDRLVAWPPTPHGARMTLIEIGISVRIWLKDVAGVAKGLKQLKKFSSQVSNSKIFRRTREIYQLRYLILKEEVQGSLSLSEDRKKNNFAGKLDALREDINDTDVHSILAVCRYYLRGDSSGIMDMLDGLLEGTLIRHSAPILSLPDLFEAARHAGLWSSKLEDWKDRAIENGMLYLELPRPHE